MATSNFEEIMLHPPALLAMSFYAGPAAFAAPVAPSVLEDRNEVVILATAVGSYLVHLNERRLAPSLPVQMLLTAKKLRGFLLDDGISASQVSLVKEELAQCLGDLDGDLSLHYRAVHAAQYSIRAVFGNRGQVPAGQLELADALLAGAGRLHDFSRQRKGYSPRAISHFATLVSALTVHCEGFGLDPFLRLGLLQSGRMTVGDFIPHLMQRGDYEDALSLIRHGGAILASAIQIPADASQGGLPL